MEGFPTPHEPGSTNDAERGTGKRSKRAQLRFGAIAKVEGQGQEKPQANPAQEGAPRERRFGLFERPEAEQAAQATEPKKEKKAEQGQASKAEAQAAAIAAELEGEPGSGRLPSAEADEPTDTAGTEAKPKAATEAKDNASQKPVSEQAAAAKQAEQDGYTPLPEQELPPTALGGGEFIIDLLQPAGERVIDLHASPEAAPDTSEVDAATAPAAAEPQPAVRREAPVFRRQLEQQHQARAEAAPDEPADDVIVPPFVNRDMPELPGVPSQPEYRAYSTQPMPEAQPQPHEAYADYASVPPELLVQQPGRYETDETGFGMPALPIAPAAQRAVPTGEVFSRQDMEDAVYGATKAGVSRGAATGLLVGGVYEHFKHKRREKKQEKRMHEQAKRLEEARQEYRFAAAQQELRQSATERALQASERQLREHAVAAAAIGPEKRFVAAPAPQSGGSERLSMLAAGSRERPIIPLGFAAERAAMGPERPQPGTTEQQRPPQAEQVPADLLEVPPEHRLETSSWHTIEVDAKTGKPVETPTFQYGHEYYRERAQENTPAAQRNSATGEIALVAAALGGIAGGAAPHGQPGSGSGGNMAGAGNQVVPSAETHGKPSPAAPSGVMPKNGRKSNAAKTTAGAGDDKPLWPWVVALAAIVICIFWLA
jgi:hypothetical protein